jgi:hypothetical protein
MEHRITPLFGPEPSWAAAHRADGFGFRSEAGARHYFLLHKHRLVAAGAVTLLNGRWHAVDPVFTELRLQIAAEAARRAVGIGEAA